MTAIALLPGGKWTSNCSVGAAWKEKLEIFIINDVIIESLPWIIKALSPPQMHNIIDSLCFFGPFRFCHFECGSKFIKQKNEQ